MCLAIYKPADTAPDWKSYENGYDDNPHSWGFAAVQDGQLVTQCGLGKFDEFRRAFEPFANCKAIIHFRWATHGGKTVANCHPFLVSKDLAVIHNGIIEIECGVNKERSDTWHFNELVLKPLHARDPDFFLRPEHRYSQELAHRGNKFVFLRADGMHDIWCESDGVWEQDGHWYSNSGYRRSRRSYYAYGSSTPSSYASPAWSHRDMSPSDNSEQVMTAREIEIDMEADDYDLRYAGDVTEGGQLIRDPYSNDELLDTGLEYMAEKLMEAGLSKATLKEVYDVFGTFGIEVLHDIM